MAGKAQNGRQELQKENIRPSNRLLSAGGFKFYAILGRRDLFCRGCGSCSLTPLAFAPLQNLGRGNGLYALRQVKPSSGWLEQGFALARLAAGGLGGTGGPNRPLLAFQASTGCLKSLIATARNHARSNPCFFYIGGDEGSRTPVRKPVYKTFYGCSRRIKSFVAARPSAGLRFRQPLDPAAVEAAPRLVPHINDARIPRRGQPGADGRAVRPLQECNCCCQLCLQSSRF